MDMGVSEIIEFNNHIYGLFIIFPQNSIVSRIEIKKISHLYRLKQNKLPLEKNAMSRYKHPKETHNPR